MTTKPSQLSRKGWTFEIADNPTSSALLEYQNLKNQDYCFAKQISVERVVVELEEDSPGDSPLTLTRNDFVEIVPSEEHRSLGYKPETKKWGIDLQNFSVYKGEAIPLALKSKPGKLPLDESGIDSPLFLVIAFLFGEYANNPPHEFTGSLVAARFTPAVRFQTKNKKVKSIRVDCRFHFRLSATLTTVPALFSTDAFNDVKQNYASVIRDAEFLPPWVLPAYQLYKELQDLRTGLESLAADLKACNYDSACQAATKPLNLTLLGSDPLTVSFVYERKTTAIHIEDSRLARLNMKSHDPEIGAVIDELTPLIRQKMHFPSSVPNSLKSLNDCVTKNIKYSLIAKAAVNYSRNKLASIRKLIQTVVVKGGEDYSSFLKELSAGEGLEMLKALWPVLDVGKVISLIGFDAVEKPILHEIAGRYVKAGSVDDTWDNLHWWGTRTMPSAPGAFFAIHSHFRWTRLNAYPSPVETELLEEGNSIIGTRKKLFLGAPQLRSLVKSFADQQLSGPLIDPNIPKQTVHFVIAKAEGQLDKALRERDSSFEILRHADFPAPEIASTGTFQKGSDIVYWLSCKAEREPVEAHKQIFKGTLLINGFYFAHDEEKPFSFFKPSAPSNLFGPTEGVAVQKPERKNTPLFRNPYDPK